MNSTVNDMAEQTAEHTAGTLLCAEVQAHLGALPYGAGFDLVIADPPYNIGKDFGNDSDQRSLADYLEWSLGWLGECLRLAKPGAPVYVYGFSEVLAHIAVRYPLENQKWLVWHYTNKTVPQLRFWQRSHETLLCLWKGPRPSLQVDAVREPYTESYVKLAGQPRKETLCRYNAKGQPSVYGVHPKGALPRDVLKTPALAGGAGRAERWFLCKTCAAVCEPGALLRHRECEIIKHPTQKPLALAERLILSALGLGGGRLLVPFAGSGSECVAAKRLGVEFLGLELNPDYVRLAQGWLAASGVAARDNSQPQAGLQLEIP